MKYNHLAAGFIALAMALAGSSAAQADEAEVSVNNAFKLCQMLDSTGSLAEPCEVSGWKSTVNISAAASPAEALKLCPGIKQVVQNHQMKFTPGWTMRVTSPYSGDKAIATCPL